MSQSKPSEVLQEALELLILAELPNSTIKPFMGAFWHFSGQKLYACFGGIYAMKKHGKITSHLKGTLDANYNVTQEIDHEVFKIQNALDMARLGNVSSLMFHLDIPIQKTWELSRPITDYSKDRELFKLEFQKLINDLKDAGY